MTAHYYPQLDWNNMTFDDFAFWSENAAWVHSQIALVQQSNALGMLGTGKKK